MNNDTGAAGRRRRKWILIGLVVLFVSPLAGSYLLFHYTSLGQHGGAGHGNLLEPPRELPDLALREAGSGSRQTQPLYGKWSLVYLIDGRCDARCDHNLYRMRQLRLAQGRNGTRVQRVLLNLGKDRVRLSDRQLREYAGQLIARPERPGDWLERFRLEEGDRPLPAQRLYLVDPRGFLIMSYARDSEPGGIIDDMRRLLRYSGAG